MREGNRVIRRFHVSRLKKKRKHYWGYPSSGRIAYDAPPVKPVEMDDSQLGKVVQYPQACSCAGCCNVRRAPNMNGGEYTLQELRYFANYKEQLVEEE